MMLVKTVLEEAPLGGGLAKAFYELLGDGYMPSSNVFGGSSALDARDGSAASAAAALELLRDYDPTEAAACAQLLRDAAPPLDGSLTMGDFRFCGHDEGCACEWCATAVTQENAQAVVHRCNWKLRAAGARRKAVREGFTSLIDLSTQLSAFTTAERVRLLQGEPRLSAAALVGCFDWSKGKSRDGDVARFDSEALPELAKTAAMLRSLLSDDTAFDDARRSPLLL